MLLNLNLSSLNDKINDRINDKINDKINKIDDIIISQIKNDKYITITKLAKLTKKSEPTIHRHIDNLVNLGIISRVGARKNGYWVVL